MKMKQRLLDRHFWIAVILGGLGGLVIGVSNIHIPTYGWVLIWLVLFAALLAYSYYKLIMPVWHMSKGHYRQSTERMTKMLAKEQLNPKIRVALLYNLAVVASRLGDFEQSKKWLETLEQEGHEIVLADRNMSGVINMLKANNILMSRLQEKEPIILKDDVQLYSETLKNERRESLRLLDDEWTSLQALFSTAEEVGRWMEFLPMVAAIEARRGEVDNEDINAMLGTYIHTVVPGAKVRKSGGVPLLFDELTYNVINPFYIAVALIAVNKDEEAKRWMLQAANCKFENVYTQVAKKWLGESFR